MKKFPIKQVILLGRKKGMISVIEFLLKNKIHIQHLVIPDDDTVMQAYAQKHNISVCTDKKIYELIDQNVSEIQNIDLVISYLFWKKIKAPLIHLGKRGCINFHPAPLPDYKGRAGYNTAILDRRSEYGVSAHFIDTEELDAGPIISVRRFLIDKNNETALSLERKSQHELLVLFKSVMNMFIKQKRIITFPNEGGMMLTKQQLENLKIIRPHDAIKTINRKIRAFFFPPYSGATIRINGKNFTVINEEILEDLAQ